VAIKLGTATPTAYKVGSSSVSKIYLGTTEVASTGGGGGTGFAVSGAGTAAANGTYCPSGTVNGRTRYSKGSYTIEYTPDWFINDEGFGPNWLIRLGGNDLYYASVSTQTPPLSGWGEFSGGSPSPTLSSATC
jgi:hypothetical protein